jgi:16S rRNA (cytosine1402-N4)-methyltransferase
MAREVLELLEVRAGGVYVDATVGPGGHSERILTHLDDGLLICIDRDAEALRRAEERLDDGRCVFVKSRFSRIREVLEGLDIGSVDGVLMDLGVSMLQMKSPDRGFSFDSDAPLDMRMDRDGRLTAAEAVNRWPEKELEKVIREYGEEWRSRRIARAIVAGRKTAPINTCRDLAGAVARAVGKRGRTHPATRTFQAIRIAVNDELGELKKGLEVAMAVLKPGGRMVVIAYHSLEDRLVKHFIKDASGRGMLKVLTKKPLTPDRSETGANPSARSAKLRAAEAI